VDEIWSDEFGEERREDICQENDSFWNRRTNEVERSGEDDNVGDIVYKAK